MEKQQPIRNHLQIYSRIIYRGEVRAGFIQLTVSGPHITMEVAVILSLNKISFKKNSAYLGCSISAVFSVSQKHVEIDL